MKPFACAAAFCVLLSSPGRAQDLPAASEPTKEHEFLKKFVGEWETTGETVEAEGQPAMKSTGTITGRMLGKFWVVSNVEGNMAGADFKALQTIGYDTKGKKYVGTWVDSVMNHMWRLEGTVDQTGKILTLEGDGPSFTGEGTAKYRDIYEFKSDNEIVTTSQMQGEDGEWVTFMKGTAKRKE